MKLKPEKNSDLNGIQTHDLRNTVTVTVLNQLLLSYQANWELLMLWVPNLSVDNEDANVCMEHYALLKI